MDKNLVNNQIVLMRKTVRNAKRFVYQKLTKHIKKLKTTSTKGKPEDVIKRHEKKLANKEKLLVCMRGVNVDEVSKQALIHNKTYFDDIIKSSQSSIELKCLARIAINESVKKAVEKFKEENPNCDQWLPSQIELWDHKKSIKRERLRKNKGLKDDDKNESNESHMKTNESDLKTKVDTEGKKKPKANNKKVNAKREDQIKTNTDKEAKKEQNVVETKKPKFDPFFLSDNMDENEELSDDSIDTNERQINVRNRPQNKGFKSEQRRDQYSKRIEKNPSRNERNFKPDYKTKTFDKSNKNDNKSKGVAQSRGNTSNEGSGESLHPSWAAKKSAKDKFKIDFNQKPLAKKIKFSDN
ncbi:unnamed protein product [Oppiella nova]|uniref:Serum response factor-binding protein 1 n=1 Tax=Oppiella nova TaxID=334625 RepID=A0A7R9LE35_9ACAR|nr:unnamed protein product [Oppiella nova]CAG2162593.1 unnamed protein product [Oppiella nova]